MLAALFRYPGRIGSRIVPGDAGHRMEQRLRKPRVLPTGGGVDVPCAVIDLAGRHVPARGARELLELADGNQVRGHRQWVADDDGLLGLLEVADRSVSR